MHIFADLPGRYDHVEDFYFGEGNCLLNVTAQGMIFWYKSSTFILPNNMQNSGKCELISENYICNISTVILNYEPKIRWMTFGYLCGEERNLSGFQYEFKAKLQNTTQCEPMHIPQNVGDFYFQCNQFYTYTTFPNVFGHRSQEEAFAILQMFQTVLENMDHSCYKHLDYTLCQAFFHVVRMVRTKTIK